jgi:hypothetical protein
MPASNNRLHGVSVIRLGLRAATEASPRTARFRPVPGRLSLRPGRSAGLFLNPPVTKGSILATRTDWRALRAKPGCRFSVCCVLAHLALPVAVRAADMVITNTPNGVLGGSSLDDSRFKSLVFTTGGRGGQVASVALGLNPALGTAAPVIQRVDIAVWSVAFDGTDYTPSSRLAGTGLLPAAITGAGGIFTFDSMASADGFFLDANTTYGLTVSSDATGIRWSNTGTTGLGTATTPTALDGYLFRRFLVSLDGGLSWDANAGNFNTVVLTVDQRIHPRSVAYASNPDNVSFNGGTLLVDVADTFATDYDTGTGGVIDGNGFRSVFSGVISGAGNLAFMNSSQGGAIELRGLNTYTGATRVGADTTLVVNGSLAASSGLFVDAGGAVRGTGSLPQTRLVAGATLAPGNSIGTLAVAGLSLNGGTLEVEFQGPRNDRIEVSGQVTDFFGTARLGASGGGSPWPHFDYTVIAAPNSAPFANPDSLVLDPSGVPSALLRHGATLVQEADGDARSFDVQWRARNGVGVAAAAVRALRPGDHKLLATAGAVDRVFQSLAGAAAGNANASGAPIDGTGFTTGQAAAAGVSTGFVSATSRLLTLAADSELVAALGTLAPEPYAAFQSVGLDSLQRQRELLLGQAGHCATNRGSVQAASGARGARDYCVFAKATRAGSGIDGRDGLADYDADVLVSVFGVEYQPANRWTVGAAYSHGNADLEDMAPSGAGIEADVNGASLYGVYRPLPSLSLRSLVGYSHFDVDGSRRVAFIGNDADLRANPAANGYTVAFDVEYLSALTSPDARARAYLKPRFGLAWGGYQQARFRERGTNDLDLVVDGHTANSLTGTLGLEVTTTLLATGGGKAAALTPRLAIAYRIDALADAADVKSLRASFAGTPAAGSFVTRGENRGMHAVLLDGGAELVLAQDVSLHASFGYEVFATGSLFSCGGGVNFAF